MFHISRKYFKEISWNKNLTKQSLNVTRTVLQNIQFTHGYVLEFILFQLTHIYTLINLHYRTYAHVVLTHQASYKHTVRSVRSCGRTEKILSVHRKIAKGGAFVAYNKDNFGLRNKSCPFDFRVVGPLYCGSDSDLRRRGVWIRVGGLWAGLMPGLHALPDRFLWNVLLRFSTWEKYFVCETRSCIFTYASQACECMGWDGWQ